MVKREDYDYHRDYDVTRPMTETPAESLRDLTARRLRELDISAREAARRSQGLVSVETVAGIVRGRYTGRYMDKTLAGLSLALQTPESVVRRAARAPEAHGPWVPHPKFTRLSLEHRAKLELLASALLDMYPEEPEDRRD